MNAKPELVAAARQLLDQMGISLTDLHDAAGTRPAAPTFTEYVPIVAAAVSPGSRRMYGTYWRKVIEQWGDRRLDEPTPTQIETLMRQHQQNALRRRNYRGGRSAAEHLISALRCLYKRAVADGIITEADNPAAKVAKPRRLDSTRNALADDRLAEIIDIAGTTGDDPELDLLIIRFHIETAARRAAAYSPYDLKTWTSPNAWSCCRRKAAPTAGSPFRQHSCNT